MSNHKIWSGVDFRRDNFESDIDSFMKRINLFSEFSDKAELADEERNSGEYSNECVDLEVLREINDHDGYCSGAENEYTAEIIKTTVQMPKGYSANTIWTYKWNHDRELKHLIPELGGGSGYCEIGEEGERHGLNCHDYRLTVLKVDTKTT